MGRGAFFLSSVVFSSRGFRRVGGVVGVSVLGGVSYFGTHKRRLSSFGNTFEVMAAEEGKTSFAFLSNLSFSHHSTHLPFHRKWL